MCRYSVPSLDIFRELYLVYLELWLAMNIHSLLVRQEAFENRLLSTTGNKNAKIGGSWYLFIEGMVLLHWRVSHTLDDDSFFLHYFDVDLDDSQCFVDFLSLGKLHVVFSIPKWPCPLTVDLYCKACLYQDIQICSRAKRARRCLHPFQLCRSMWDNILALDVSFSLRWSYFWEVNVCPSICKPWLPIHKPSVSRSSCSRTIYTTQQRQFW